MSILSVKRPRIALLHVKFYQCPVSCYYDKMQSNVVITYTVYKRFSLIKLISCSGKSKSDLIWTKCPSELLVYIFYFIYLLIFYRNTAFRMIPFSESCVSQIGAFILLDYREENFKKMYLRNMQLHEEGN